MLRRVQARCGSLQTGAYGSSHAHCRQQFSSVCVRNEDPPSKGDRLAGMPALPAHAQAALIRPLCLRLHLMIACLLRTSSTKMTVGTWAGMPVATPS